MPMEISTWLVGCNSTAGLFLACTTLLISQNPSPHSARESLSRKMHSSKNNVHKGEPGFSYLELKLGSGCANQDPASDALKEQRKILCLPVAP